MPPQILPFPRFSYLRPNNGLTGIEVFAASPTIPNDKNDCKTEMPMAVVQSRRGGGINPNQRHFSNL
jgi:hypothetical protein